MPLKEVIIAHDARCSDSVRTPPRDCECSCGKQLHGIPHSERGSAFYAAPNERATRAERVTEQFRLTLDRAGGGAAWSESATDFAAAKLTQEAIAADFELSTISGAISSAFLEALFEAVSTDVVDASAADRIDSVVQSAHIFCSIAVMLLKLEGMMKDVLDGIRGELVDVAVDAAFPREGSGDVVRGVVRGALTAGFDMGLKAFEAALQKDVAITTVRFLGVLSCPDVADHPDDEVSVYCVRPLTADYLSDTFARWVKAWNPDVALPADA